MESLSDRMRLSYLLTEGAVPWFDNVSKQDANLLVSWWNANDPKHRYYREGYHDGRGHMRWRVKRDPVGIREEKGQYGIGYRSGRVTYCACGRSNDLRWVHPVHGIGERITGWTQNGTTEDGEAYAGCLSCGRIIQVSGDQDLKVVDKIDPDTICP